MSRSCSFVRGQVVNDATHAAVSDVVVGLSHVVGRRRTLLRSVTAEADGRFVIDVRAAASQGGASVSGRYELSVTRGGATLEIKGGRWRWLAGSDPGEVQLCVGVPATCAPTVPDAPDEALKSKYVYGRVLHHDGTPVPGVVVRISSLQIDGLTELGTTTTADSLSADPAGSFAYTLAAETSTLNLVAQVLVAGAGGRLLATVPPKYGVSGPIRLDITICDEAYRAPSEWARYKPGLEAGRGTILYRLLDARHVAFLSGQTKVPVERVNWWIQARILEAALALPVATILEATVAEAIYGLQYAGLPADPRVLHERGQKRLERALTIAFRDNIIGEAASLLFEALTAGLRAWRGAQLSDPTNADSLTALFSCSGILTEDQVTGIVHLYKNYAGDRTAFWSNLGSLWPLVPDAVTEAQRLVTLAGLAYAHPPTVEAITNAIAHGVASLTAGLTEDAWNTLVATIAVLPHGVDGDGDEEQRLNYAAQLRENAQAAYPGAAVRARIEGDLTFHEGIRTFTLVNGGFDFERDDVLARSGAGTPYAWTATDDAERSAVATFQRLHRIAPLSDRFEGARQMYEMGITSARSISRRGPMRAIAALTGVGMSAGDARLTVVRASQASAKALTLFTQAHSNLTGVKLSGNGTWPESKGLYSRFLVADDVDTDGVPSWEALFGNVDFCTCEDCKAITGPAAYLVDLLNWLDARDGWGEKLEARRPDLGDVLLTCANTNRVMPYIDLALEVMENAAASLMEVALLPLTSTDAEGAELLASPQNVNHAVYTELATTIAPISLPFDRALTEARVFLRHLGVDRIVLQRAFVVPELGATDPEIDEEALGLFAGALAAITTAGGAGENDRWGVASITELCEVETFLLRAEISFEELLDVLHARYVNGRAEPTGSARLTLDYDDACDLDDYELVFNTMGVAPDWHDGVFGRIRQLLRLRKATGWSIRELDSVLRALGATTAITPTVVQKIGGISALTRRSGHSPVELAAWFAPMDWWDDRASADDPAPSLYERVFLNPSVFPIADRSVVGSKAHDLTLGILVDSGREPNVNATALDTFGLSEIQALVGIDAESAAAIRATLDVEATVTRTTLTTFYRWAALARAADLSVVDALALKALWGQVPFSSPSWASRFLDQAQELREAGLTVTDLRFLIEHDAKAVTRLAPRDTWYDDVLGRLCTKLEDHFKAAGSPPNDPGHELLDDLLLSIFPGNPSELAEIKTAIAGTEEETLGEFASLAGHCDTAAFLAELGLLEALDPDDDAQEVQARQLWAAQELSRWKAAQALVVTHFAQALQVPEAVLETLRGVQFDSLSLLDPAPHPEGPFADWTNLWLSSNFRDSGASAAVPLAREDYAHEFEFVGTLVKVAFVVSRLGLGADEVAFWAGAGLVAPWSFWSLPTITGTSAATSPTASYSGVKNLIDLARLRQRLPGSEPTLATLLAEAADADFTGYAELLAKRTGWDALELAQIGADIEMATPGSRSGAQVLLQQVEAFALVRRTGATAAAVAGWVGEITAVESAEVVLAARSRYDNSAAWAKVARPLRDQLRKQQRDALVAYLVANSGTEVEDADDLYGKLLIDTQMNPEMLTARIKQATCSAQLYVQRNMMGIETEVSFNEDDRAEWEWMKNYRVWEAARKVFLYPENWIEPELRDVKSAFFKTLENELSQGDVTDERAEDAALAYLDRLHEVARPQVLGYYVQRETTEDEEGTEETIDVLHAFARSRGQTPTYWYRRWEDQKTWTPWEKVECGVEGTHLVPVIYQRQLYLFWFIIDDTGSDEEDADPSSWYSVRLAWSTYRDGKWQPKNEAEEALSLEDAWTGSTVMTDGEYATRASARAKTRFHFLSSESGDGSLELRCICWHPGALAWYEIGTFDLNPCTRAVATTAAASQLLDGTFIPTTGGFEAALTSTTWAALSGEQRTEIMGNHDADYWSGQSLEDLSSDAWAKFRSYLVTTYDELYTNEWEEGAPIEATLLARVEGTFLAPGYQGATELGGGEHLTLYLGDWDTNLQAVDGGEQEVKLLGTLGESCVVLPTQFQDFVSQVPFFVEAENRTYFVVRETQSAEGVIVGGLTVLDKVSESAVAAALNKADELAVGDNLVLLDQKTPHSPDPTWVGEYRFDNFFHPHVCGFIMEARREGIASLLDPSETGSAAALSRQQLYGEPDYFETTFAPTHRVKLPYPQDDVDFAESGAYALYNWELFFHLPLYVANRLTDNQRFEDAMRWYSFIFDPLNRPKPGSTWEDAPARFWKIKPFLEPVTAPVGDWITFTGADGDSDAADAFERQVEEWRDDPFNPHLLARLRPGTYQKTIVMRYIENLIQWGDQLFARDTIETINEATQLYILGKQILGDRPEKLKRPTAPASKSFNDLREDGLDAFSNSTSTDGVVTISATSPVVWLEGMSRAGRWDPLSSARIGTFRLGSAEPTPSVGGDTYFCIPPNPKLLGYWDTVDDRLFKIRNSLNIEGVFRTLPLYEPPIDPALLVRASALGVDIGSVLSDLSMPLPGHRFSAMLPRAQALAGSVRALGGALLSALEKRDAEALSLLRSSHEITLLGMVRQSKEKAIDEAIENLAATRLTRKTVEARRDYYGKLIAKGWSGEEVAAALLQNVATAFETTAGVMNFLGGVMGVSPDVYVGTLAGVKSGGDTFSRVLGGFSSGFSAMSAHTRGQAGYLSTVAGYKRRAEDWGNQKKLAEREITQIDRQIAAGEIRVALSKHELTVHDTQAKQADEVRSWMESKFTNQQLYDWMVSQLSATYYQSYQLAYRAAKRAEACYRYELGREDAYVTSAYWDNTRKGLLAGELLGYDLERLDAAYLENNRREFELTKHVSLSQLDPVALLALQETGECSFAIGEVEFDLDFPGHYFRRIQSVSVTLAAAAGRHGTINAELELSTSHTRITPDATVDPTSDQATVETIAVSGAVDDAGLFRVDFNDPRYLPFERRGVISNWRLRLTGRPRQFDWSALADAIFHVRYTARNGGQTFRDDVEAAVVTRLNDEDTVGGALKATGTYLGVSAARDFPDAWHQFLHPTGTAEGQTLTLNIDEHLLSHALGTMNRTVDKLWVYLIPSVRTNSAAFGTLPAEGTLNGVPLGRETAEEDVYEEDGTFAYSAASPGLPLAVLNPLQTVLTVLTPVTTELGTLALKVSPSTALLAALRSTTESPHRLNAVAFADLVVILRYGVSTS